MTEWLHSTGPLITERELGIGALMCLGKKGSAVNFESVFYWLMPLDIDLRVGGVIWPNF